MNGNLPQTCNAMAVHICPEFLCVSLRWPTFFGYCVQRLAKLRAIDCLLLKQLGSKSLRISDRIRYLGNV